MQALALDLRDAGFGVTFAPSWTPVAGRVEIGLGILGAEQELQSFLEAHPSWRGPLRPLRGWIAGKIQGTLREHENAVLAQVFPVDSELLGGYP